MVQVHCHPSPIEVSYKAVRRIVPSLIFADESSKPNFDIVVHLGMTNRPFYALETQARRDGFVKDDVTGSQLLDPEFWENQYGAPEVLKTGFDCEKTLYKWKKNLQVKAHLLLFLCQDTSLPLPCIQAGGDVRLSHQAGLFLCEFTYYTGMLEYWRRGWKEAIPVVFLHVPIGFEDEDISRGRDITTALIKALVESKVER